MTTPERTPVQFLIRIIGWMVSPIAFVFWYGAAVIPAAAMPGVASAIGKLLRTRTKRVTTRKMTVVLGGESARANHSDLWSLHAQHVARVIFELIRSSRIGPRCILEHVSVEGEEYLKAALSSGRRVVIFHNHLGNFMYGIGALAARGYPLTVARNRIWIPFLEWKVEQLLRSFGVKSTIVGETVPRTPSRTAGERMFSTFVDFSMIERRAIWTKFGKGELRVHIGPAVVALRRDAEVLSATCLRTGNDHHLLKIHPPIRFQPSGHIDQDAQELTRRALALVERGLLDHPEQWWPWNYASLRVSRDAATPRSRSEVLVEEFQ